MIRKLAKAGKTLNISAKRDLANGLAVKRRRAARAIATQRAHHASSFQRFMLDRRHVTFR